MENKAYILIENEVFDRTKKISGRDYEEIRCEDGILVDGRHIVDMIYDLLDELDYQQNLFEEKEQQFQTMYSDEGLQTRIAILENSLNAERRKRQALEKVIKGE